MGEKVLSYIQDRIAKLWRFKAQKVKKIQEEDCLAFFKPGLW